MPGAVNVNRSTFKDELPILPSSLYGERSAGAGLASGYRGFTPAGGTRLQSAVHQNLHPPDLSGVVVNHSPAESGRYIGSSSLALLPNGEYVASHDFFGPKANHTDHAATLIFVSRDNGQTWRRTKLTAYRNYLVLASTADLRNWRVEAPLLYHTDTQRHAWQYVDWQFEGDDIVFVSRTAFDDNLDGAQSAYDANYLTFHPIQDFRCLGPDHT